PARQRRLLVDLLGHPAAVDHATVRRGALDRHARNAHDRPAPRRAGGPEQVPGVLLVLPAALAAHALISAAPTRPARQPLPPGLYAVERHPPGWLSGSGTGPARRRRPP